jgi:hypothetical protein
MLSVRLCQVKSWGFRNDIARIQVERFHHRMELAFRRPQSVCPWSGEAEIFFFLKGLGSPLVLEFRPGAVAPGVPSVVIETRWYGDFYDVKCQTESK